MCRFFLPAPPVFGAKGPRPHIGLYHHTKEAQAMTLDQAKLGQTVTVLRVRGEGALRRRLLDMGVLRGTEITV